MTDDRDEDGEIRSPRDKKIRDAIVRPLFGDKHINTTGHVTGLWCKHDFVTIVRGNMHEPIGVWCRQCKEKLNPLLVLANLARAWDNVTYAERELSELRAKAEEFKREASNAKGRIRNARKKADNPRADEYFEELLRRINAVTCRAEAQEVGRWERSFKWLETEHYTKLNDAWREAERRIEDHNRDVGRQRKAGVKVLDGGKAS